MKRVLSFPKNAQDAVLSLHRDPTESMSEDDEDDLSDDCLQPTSQAVVVTTQTKTRRVIIREDLNTEHLNWQAPKTLEELELCFIKSTDKALFRRNNSDCIIRYHRRTVELGLDWNDACDHLLGSVRGLEEFQSPQTYHRASKARKVQHAAVLKMQAKLTRRTNMRVDVKWQVLQGVAMRYSKESVELAQRLAQPHDYQMTIERPSLWMKLRSGLLK